MKKYLLLIPIFCISFLGTVQAQQSIKPSGNIVEKSYDFKGFTKLELSNDFLAYVTMTDDGDKVSIKADDNLYKYIVAELDGTTLKIKLADHINIRGKETLKAYISSRYLNDFRASGDAEIYLENELKANKLKVKLTGDSKFNGALDVSTMELVLRGDSEMDVTGSAHAVKANLKGDSVIESYKFAVDLLEINLAGDSEAFLTVKDKIDIIAVGDSELHYKGNAEIKRKRLIGDSEIHKMD